LVVILDENIPPAIADFLHSRRPEWDTFDEDFADTRMYPAGTHAGVIRLRVWPTTIEQIEAALDRLFNATGDDQLPGSLIIIDAQRIRIRRSARHG
jgi:predicted nuclease of predicted toxin-antitoxin system